MPVVNRIAAMTDEITAWRHDFHEHPELQYDVHRTAGIVAEKLKAFGCDEVVPGIGRTGVVGVIRGRKSASGKVIGLRADMDALPLQEITGLPYASKTPGMMHACGHDGHTAMLLGAAKYLCETRNFDGTAIVVFQPAEEGGAGGKAMVDDGLMTRWNIQEVKYRVVAYDFGIKHNILRRLRQEGFAVDVVNARTTAEEVLAKNPDGVFLSNGPGDPAALDYIHREVRKLTGKKPVFAICLGHQILGHAFGGKTFKLKFGHRGGNQPVKDLRSGTVAITSQNHGFAVDADSLPSNVEVTHINLNDGTVEGLRHREAPVFSVQYHPEAAPGPNDARYFFHEFSALIESAR